MKILGLDLSLTATGCVVLENGELKKSELIKTKSPESKTPDTELKRLFEIRDKIVIDGMDIIVLEGLSMMTHRTTSLVQLSGLNYLIREKIYNAGIPFLVVPPTSLKKFILGKGNGAKELMLLETYKKYNVEFDDNNLCDAFALAKVGEAILNINNAIEQKLNQKQIEVIDIIIKQILIK
jgi:Holliday junction resolvasome RuvABC endonuclease subunit